MEDFEDLSEKIIAQSTDALADDEGQAGELLEILLNTREQGQMMEQLIKNQIEVKDEMINKLHKELDYYKQDAADRFVDQLMKAVIKVRKDMTRLTTSDKWEDSHPPHSSAWQAWEPAWAPRLERGYPRARAFRWRWARSAGW